jgi:hypothetical protein
MAATHYLVGHLSRFRSSLLSSGFAISAAGRSIAKFLDRNLLFQGHLQRPIRHPNQGTTQEIRSLLVTAGLEQWTNRTRSNDSSRSGWSPHQDSDCWEYLHSRTGRCDTCEQTAGRFGNDGFLFTTADRDLLKLRRSVLNPRFSKRGVLSFQWAIRGKVEILASTLRKTKTMLRFCPSTKRLALLPRILLVNSCSVLPPPLGFAGFQRVLP